MISGEPTVTCTCGHADELDRFCETPVGGPLPYGTYQCPSCKKAWRIERAKPKLYPDGFIMPGKQTLEREATRL